MAGPPLTLITAADSRALDAACGRLLRQAGRSAVLLTADPPRVERLQPGEDQPAGWAVHSFASFSRRLLEQAGSPLRVASPLQRRWLIYRHAPQWFPAAAGGGPAPSGLRRLLHAWWLRMEAHGITPDQLSTAAPECDYPKRAEDLSGLLTALQCGLTGQGLITDAALPAAAASVVAQGGIDTPMTVILHRLERLTKPQIELLAALARAGTAITMTAWYDPARPAVSTDLEPTRDALDRRFALTLIDASEQPEPAAPEALVHLSRSLWSPEPTAICAAGRIHCVEAPDSLSEAEQVARMCLALHARGTDWRQITVCATTWDAALPMLTDQFTRFHIPWTAPEARTLPVRHPARMLRTLWMMTSQGLSHHTLSELLDSIPGRLPHRERQRLLEWSVQIDSTTPPQAVLESLDDGLLDEPARQMVRRLLQWVNGSRLCQTLAQRCVLLRTTAAALAPGERSDVDPLSRLLDAAQSAARIVDTHYLPDEGEAFVREVWDDDHPAAPEITDAVAIVSMQLARTMTCTHMHLFGMQEGALPSRPTDDPILGADLGRLLNERFQALLPTASDEAAAERRRFLQVCERTTGTLSFSWSRLSGDTDLQRSSWMEPLLQLFDSHSVPVRTIRQHQLTSAPDEAVDTPDRWLTSVDRLFDRSVHTRPAVSLEDIRTVSAWMTAWLADTPEVISQWLSWHVGPRRPRLQTHTALPDDLCVTAGELQDLIACPFRWFALHRLGLTSQDYRYTAAQARWLRRAATTAASDAPETLWMHIIRTEPPRCSPGERTLLLEDTLRLMQTGAAREQRWEQRAPRQSIGRRVRYGQRPPGSDEPPNPPLALPLTAETRLQISGQLDRLDRLSDGHAVLTVYFRQLPADWWELLAQGLLLEVTLGVSATRHSIRQLPAAVWLDCAVSDTRCSVLLVNTGSASATEACRRQPGEPAGLHRFAGEAIWNRALQQTATRIRSAVNAVQTGEVRPHPEVLRCAGCPWRILCRTRPAPHGATHDGEPLDDTDLWDAQTHTNTS